MKTPLLLLLAAGSAALASCAATSRRYADGLLGYSMTRGSVIKMENVYSESNERLANGVAIKVNGEGGKVLMRMGDLVKPIEVFPGSVIILSTTGDYLLNSMVRPAGGPDR